MQPAYPIPCSLIFLIKQSKAKNADLGLITNPHFFKKVQTIPLFEEAALVFVCGEDAPYQDRTSSCTA